MELVQLAAMGGIAAAVGAIVGVVGYLGVSDVESFDWRKLAFTVGLYAGTGLLAGLATDDVKSAIIAALGIDVVVGAGKKRGVIPLTK